MPWIDCWKLPKTVRDRIRILRRARHGMVNQRFFVYRPGLAIHEPRDPDLQFDRRSREEGRQPQATEDQRSFHKGRTHVDSSTLLATLKK